MASSPSAHSACVRVLNPMAAMAEMKPAGQCAWGPNRGEGPMGARPLLGDMVRTTIRNLPISHPALRNPAS
eukprot:6984731-Alexandrium_andersonii.AAC.1